MGARGAEPRLWTIRGWSLHARLILAFAAIIALSLLLASAVAVALLKGEQERAARDRLAMSVLPIRADLAVLTWRGAGVEQISTYVQQVAEERGLRLLLVDPEGSVVLDTGGQLEGQQVTVDRRPTRRIREVEYAAWTAHPGGERDALVLFNVSIRSRNLSPPLGAADQPGALSVLLAVPETDITREWLELLPGFFWAGGVAFIAAVVVALLVARSIARPLRAMTEASEAMAGGDYDRAVPEGGSGEVRRLASSFNLMARQVSRSHALLRSFVANVSHDLKTPLTSILGFSQAMMDGAVESPEQVRETGRIIHEEAERMQRLVDDLLYLSRMEAGQIPLVLRNVDVAALVRGSAERLRHGLDGRSLEVSVPERPLVVRGDGDKLERAVTNVVQNAVAHSPTGAAVRVDVAEGSGGVRIAVHNTGSYIPPHERERIFDRFHQVERSRSGRLRGHGLGLAIAREIVGLHGGRIEVESDPDAGTTFTIHLPEGAGA